MTPATAQVRARKALDELQLTEGRETNNQVGLDPVASVTTPSWTEVIEREAEAGAAYYALGRAEGFRAGWEACEQAAQDARRGAEVARLGVDAIDTVNARQRAAQRQAEVVARWSA